jgi:hypothetical protein
LVVRFRIRARFDPADWQIAEVENEKSKEVPMTEVYEELREKGFNFAEMAEGNWKKNLAGTAACENSIAGNADGLVVPRNVPSVPASQPAPPNAIAKPTAQYLSEMIRWTLGPLVDPQRFGLDLAVRMAEWEETADTEHPDVIAGSPWSKMLAFGHRLTRTKHLEA